jgi:hypothetical protein
MTDLAVSPDGRLVVGSSGNPDLEDNAPGDIFIWDGTTGDLLLTLPREHTRTVNSVEISPDGQTMLSASDDNLLILWNLATGQVLKRFAGHSDDVNIGLFNPNPERPFIISASDDASIILWDIASGLPLRRFQGHTTPVTGLNLSADGLRMISSTGSDTMIVWRIETPQEVINWTLANRFVRPFSPDECVQYNVPNCNANLAAAPDVPTLEAIPTLPVQATEIPADQPTAADAPTLVPSPTEAAQTQVTAINAGSQNVNVRASDSTQAGVVDMLAVNERVQVLGVSNRDANWYQIMLADGRLAWVAGTVVRLEGDLISLPPIDPPPVTAPPAQNNPPAPTANGSGEAAPAATEDSASAYDCSAFRLTSPIGYINNGPTTFYWDPLPGVTGDYWVSVFNEAGQQVALSNVGNAFSATIDTSAATIGPGFTYSYEVNVFVNGAAVCPGSGSAGQRPS